MVCYTILFSGIATPAHVPDRCIRRMQHILFNDAQSLMGRYYARGLIRVRAGDFLELLAEGEKRAGAGFEGVRASN